MVQGFRDYLAATDYLYGLKSTGVRFGIDRMTRLAAALGHPERAYPVIHVAGTNGKGSVSALLDAIFHAAGWRTGLYTSPHLVKLGERVQVDRRLLSEEEILAYTNELAPVAAELGRLGPDEHFVLGDRRDASTDSRDFGPVRAASIEGVAALRYWPPGRVGLLRRPRREFAAVDGADAPRR